MMRYGVEYRVYRENTYNWASLRASSTSEQLPPTARSDSSAAPPKGGGLANFLLGHSDSGGNIVSNDSWAYQNTGLGLFLQRRLEGHSPPDRQPGLALRDAKGLSPSASIAACADSTSPTSSPVEAQRDANYAAGPFRSARQQLPRRGRAALSRHVGRTATDLTEPRREQLRAAYRLRLSRSIARTVSPRRIRHLLRSVGTPRLSFNQTGFQPVDDLMLHLDNGQTFIASIANPFPNGFQHATGIDGGSPTNPRPVRQLLRPENW